MVIPVVALQALEKADLLAVEPQTADGHVGTETSIAQ
jgi:hypothetical protein